MTNRHYHPYHLVDVSPWPILAALGTLFLTIGGALTMHFYEGGTKLLMGGLLSVLLVMVLWLRDVIREGVFQMKHTPAVDKGLKIGFALFIVSEVMFFFAFFWTFFHSSLSPAIQIGCYWPPMGIIPLNALEVPLLNTVILLTSGATITIAHYGILGNLPKIVLGGFIGTIILAFLFTFFQYYEYVNASFDISDSVYGSIFYMSTGFHGFHVIIGTIFITVNMIRFIRGHFDSNNHQGFEFGAWYWHFVDVVWIFLFSCVYFWGNL